MSVHVWYHKGCMDGAGAAYAAYQRFGARATYTPVAHGSPPPEVEPGSTVYILDFSFKRPVMEALLAKYNIYCLDHHTTAKDDLEGLPGCHFDMSQSGAVLAWKNFVNIQPSVLLQYIQDRDLWRWELPHSREVNAYLQATLPRTIDVSTVDQWDQVRLELSNNPCNIIRAGAMLLKIAQDLVELQAKAAKVQHLSLNSETAYKVAVCNATAHVSELGNHLCKTLNVDCALVYQVLKTEVKCSLRSIGDFDVSAIAKTYGGGGHPNAAGFNVSFNELRKFQ